MFSVGLFRELYLHMEWADALLWSSISASDTARADPSMLEKLRHIHRTQQYFLKLWRGDDLTYQEMKFSFEEEIALARSWHAEARVWIKTLDDDALTRAMSAPWADRFAQRAGANRADPTRLGETMYQVVAHTTYHRGQANTLLRLSGVTPPNLDYIAWLWMGRPTPQWPSER